MTSHTLTHQEARRPRPRRPARRSITQLGWLHYWVIIAILGGMLALVALVFLIVTRT
jgi:hypothetical protein